MQTVNELTAKQEELNARIASITAAAVEGRAQDLGKFNIRELACEAAELRSQIEAAREQEKEVNHALAIQRYDERRAALDAAMDEAAKQKQLFAQLFRDASLALGRYCLEMEKSTGLANALITRLGMPAEITNRLRELQTNQNPLPDLLDSGLKPVLGYGWNLGFSIAPLQPRIAEPSSAALRPSGGS